MFLWRSIALPGISVAFTDAGAGNLALHVGDEPAAVLNRRDQVARSAGIAPRSFQFMNQVHGNHVAFVEASDGAPTADAMLSRELPLAVMVADCIPVILVGTSVTAKPVIGAVHAGRPGIASGVIPAAVAGMRESGVTEIRAWIGPSICGECYEVPENMRADVAALVPSTWTTTSWGTPGLDLPAGARNQLETAGVVVEYAGPCTLENEELFSYRRNPHTGRFAGLVWIHD